MKFLRKLIFIPLIFLFIQPTVCAQDIEKIVTIKVSGNGNSLEEARQMALRSDVEQVMVSLISSNTKILNDKVVDDQITSLSNGNIQSFSILNETQLPDGSWGVTLKALISVNKLTSFVEAKGVAVEIMGENFALDIKQKILDEQGEIKAVIEMRDLLHDLMQVSFDYEIKSDEPRSSGKNNINWEIPLTVSAIANKNMDFCANYCIKTLAAVSLSTEEVQNYKSLKKPIYQVAINYNGITNIYYLRKEASIKALNAYTMWWGIFIRLFIIESNKRKFPIGIGEGNLYNFSNYPKIVNNTTNQFEQPTFESVKIINFLSSGQNAATFRWKDSLTLAQIEQVTGYQVKSTGGLLVGEKKMINEFLQRMSVLYRDLNFYVGSAN